MSTDPKFYIQFEKLLLEVEKVLDDSENERMESLDFEPLREEATESRRLLAETQPRSSTRRG